MTVEPGHDPLDRERVPRPTTQHAASGQSTPNGPNGTTNGSTPYHAVRHGSHVEESPELLRWRADLLLDEMMMGGVDVSAADTNRTFSGVDAPVMQRPSASAEPSASQPVDPRTVDRSSTSSTSSTTNRPEYVARDYDARDYEARENGARDRDVPATRNGHYDAPDRNGYGRAPSQPAPSPAQSSSPTPEQARGRYDGDAYGGDQAANGRDANGYYEHGPYENRYGGAERDVRLPRSPSSIEQNDADHTHGAVGARPGDMASRGYPRPDTGQTAGPESPSNFAPRPHEAQPTRRDDFQDDYTRGGSARYGDASREQPRYDESRYDTAGGDGYDGPQHEASRYDANVPPRTQPTPEPYARGGVDERRGTQAPESRRPEPQPYRDAPRDELRDDSRDVPYRERYGDGARPSHDADASDARRLPPRDEGPNIVSPVAGAPTAGSPEGATQEQPRTDRLYAVEQQYEQFRRQQSENIQPVDPATLASGRAEAARPKERPPLPPVEPTRHASAAPRVTPQPVDEQTQWATGADKWDYRDFGADPNAPVEEEVVRREARLPERRYAEDSAVRHDPAGFVSAMSVGNGGKKRSTLLPRSSELDVDTLHREISELHGEIAALLPVGNETSERARHLLDKAYSILQSDPSRSAEVEYYMQQVRTIVLRLRQSRQWSDLYRQRLRVYLLGWLGLSAMVLIARFFFQIDLDALVMWVTGVAPDSWVVAHWSTFVGTAGAGAFGGALGALYTMRGHARGEHSFFDRKYGLRGLILPFMGLIVGMLGYVIFGVVFALLGVSPAENLTLAVIPTTAALAFGFSQESIYGTRD